MIHPETHAVTAPPDPCRFCGQPVGSDHAPSCVCRTRTVVIRAVIEYPVRVPESWTPEDVDLARNEGSWCADNVITELDALVSDDNFPCLCRVARFSYLREATAEDEAMDGEVPAPVPDSVKDLADLEAFLAWIREDPMRLAGDGYAEQLWWENRRKLNSPS